MNVIDEYLVAVNKAYGKGNATEHTYRSALERLIQGLGKKVTATNEAKREECGAPDILVSRQQRSVDVTIGYVEAKDIGVNLGQILKTDQLKRYLPSLHNLILTDYIEFRWYVGGEHRMTARLAEEGAGKFAATEESKGKVAELLGAFLEQEGERITAARILAERMAAIARLLRGMIETTFEAEGEKGSLHGQLEAFRKVLLHDLEEKEFADMYAQTICYGLFAARCHINDMSLMGKDEHAVFHGRDGKREEFTREHAGYLLPKTNPFLQKLFHHIAGPDLPSEIAWLVDDLVAVLQRAAMDKVLKGFAKESKRKDPVIHFYETFLAEYDRKLRESRGVYYTPEPVVGYIVRSVDYILRTRFGLKKGLADESKVRLKVERDKKQGKGKTVDWKEIHKLLILDPATGTGTFLHEVVEQIHKKFARNKGVWNGYVRDHLLPRVYGFELMMAPYAMAHMKMGLQLAESGYDFGSDERLRIFLTNTLEEAGEVSDSLFAHFLTEEARKANEVKRDLPVMVVLGNPPYSGLSANMNEWTETLLKQKLPGENGAQSYYEVDGQPLGEKKVWLQDDYVKFIRFGQWRIEQTGSGVMAFITNHGYLDNPTFRGMRQSLLQTFDEIYIVDLHGNNKKKETCPDGSADKNVFDIQQGVAIGIFIKNGAKGKNGIVYHTDSYGTRETKYEWLASNDMEKTQWTCLSPNSPYYFFVPKDEKVRGEYERYSKIVDIMPVNSSGIVTARDSFVVEFDENVLVERIGEFRIPELSDGDIRNRYFQGKGSAKYLPGDTRSWKIAEVRKKVASDPDWKIRARDLLYRPFDTRKVYYTEWMVDWPRTEIMGHMLARENLGLGTTRSIEIGRGWEHVFCTKNMIQHHTVSLKEVNYLFPLYLYPSEANQDLFDAEDGGEGEGGRKANLNEDYVAELAGKVKMEYVGDGRGDLKGSFGPEDVLAYIYGVFHSMAYRARYAEFLKIDFPRVPWPSGKVMFRKFAEAGHELMGLHLLEAAVLEDEGRRPRFDVEGDMEVAKGYPKYVAKAGEAGKVYINGEQYFEGVEKAVWEFQVGGYQVCEKWLKDRRGRKLSYDDIDHYQKVAAALGETVRIMGQRFMDEPWE